MAAAENGVEARERNASGAVGHHFGAVLLRRRSPVWRRLASEVADGAAAVSGNNEAEGTSSR